MLFPPYLFCRYRADTQTYQPYNKDWIKEKIYVLLRRQAQQAGKWAVKLTQSPGLGGNGKQQCGYVKEATDFGMLCFVSHCLSCWIFIVRRGLFCLETGGVCLCFNILYLTIIPVSLADFAITVNKQVLRFLSLLNFIYWKLLIYVSLDNNIHLSQWPKSPCFRFEVEGF